MSMEESIRAADILARTARLAADYPFVGLQTIGYSVLGRALFTLSMGRGAPQVYINATHHGNEWITSLLVLRYFEAYAKAVQTGGDIAGTPASDLFYGTTLFLTPLVDPDGMDIALSQAPPDVMAAARQLSLTQPAVPFPQGWKANATGTDLNLNYPAGWDTARELKAAQGVTEPGPRDYVGTAPLSAPESRAVYDFTRAKDFRLILAYHTQGEVIYWRYGTQDPPDAERIGRRLAAASGYALEDTPYQSAFAGYKDWFIQAFNRPGYTVEAGRGQNPLPLSQLDNMYEKNAPLLTAALLSAMEL
ncbi:MAG: M14 family metallocarboxypeptidase [Clostridia bacterium]|nr:M14 family metallocarboxypeptidase [Clostridia bacterium]